MTRPEDWTLPNGRHQGERIARVPVSYLKWMVNVRHSEASRARAERDLGDLERQIEHLRAELRDQRQRWQARFGKDPVNCPSCGRAIKSANGRCGFCA